MVQFIGPNRMTVSSTCSPTPSTQVSNRLQNDSVNNFTENQNTCDRLANETNRFDGYTETIAIPPNLIPTNSVKTNGNTVIPTNLPSIDNFQCILNRRQRGEKRPIPDEQKDEKYFERRKRNNEAAKKSRDARKIREDRVSIETIAISWFWLVFKCLVDFSIFLIINFFTVWSQTVQCKFFTWNVQNWK